MVKLGGSADYKKIFDVNLYGAGGFIAMGSSAKDSSWEVSFNYTLGETQNGLGIKRWRIGYNWDWRLNRFHFGFGPTLGHIVIERATSKYSLEGAFIGLDVHASFDFLKISDNAAFYLGVGVNVDGQDFGPALTLGIRADVLPKASPKKRSFR